MDIDKINAKYEVQHLRNTAAIENIIDQIWSSAYTQIALLYKRNLPKQIFNQQLNKLLREISNQQTLTIQTGIQQAWQISNEKTFAFLDKRLQGAELPPSLQATFYDPNLDALQKFQQRKVAGLDLSERVWNHTKRAKVILDEGLQSVEHGISSGESAAGIARKVRESLNNPDIFFRRVRNEKGKLVESKASKAFNPGQGVYKSPVKNAQRLTRTETNMAYRDADGAAWEKNPIILGYKIQLSKSGKPKIRCEVCKAMVGVYPVDYKWNGNHPNCLCFKTPVFMDRENMDKYVSLIASGQDSASAVEALRVNAGLIKDMPYGFVKYVKDNYENIKRWKSTPYWITNNKGIISSIVKAK